VYFVVLTYGAERSASFARYAEAELVSLALSVEVVRNGVFQNDVGAINEDPDVAASATPGTAITSSATRTGRKRIDLNMMGSLNRLGAEIAPGGID
jgi:hypothetical protein